MTELSDMYEFLLLSGVLARGDSAEASLFLIRRTIRGEALARAASVKFGWGEEDEVCACVCACVCVVVRVHAVPPTVRNCPYFYANYLRNTGGMLINTEAI